MEHSQFRSRRTPTPASIVGRVKAPSLTEKVDIIVHCLFTDGSIRHETNLTSHSELRAFLQSPPSASTGHYLLSIEDISAKVVEDLTDCLHIQADVFKHHTRGRLNSDDSRHVESVLHSEQLVSTLLGRASARKDNYSLTWWKLSTHSLSQYSFEIEALTESNADLLRLWYRISTSKSPTPEERLALPRCKWLRSGVVSTSFSDNGRKPKMKQNVSQERSWWRKQFARCIPTHIEPTKSSPR
jgi:hypothetical protein